MQTDSDSYTKPVRRKRVDKYVKLIQSDEPVINPDIKIHRMDMILLVSWYHQRYTGEEGRAWLIDYCEKFFPEYTERAKVGKLYYVQPCAYARLILRGAQLPEETVTWLHKFIKNMEMPEVKKPVNDRIQMAQSAKKVRSEERTDRFDEFMALLEQEYDRLIQGGKTQLDIFKEFQNFNPTGVKVREFIKDMKIRLKDIKDSLKKGSDLAEAYDIYPRMRIRAFESFYITAIEAADRYIKGGTTKKQRKPRAKKYVPIERKIANVQLGAGSIFGIKTLPPESVLDASAVVVYNNKYNQLSLIVSDQGKLSIKGTTIQGISEKSSIRKRIKKPQETLAKVNKAINTNAIVNIFDTVKNQATVVTGRLNEDTYLIKVFK